LYSSSYSNNVMMGTENLLKIGDKLGINYRQKSGKFCPGGTTTAGAVGRILRRPSG